MSPRTFWKVFLYFHGIKKGCRKADRHQIPMGDFPIDIADANLIENARATLSLQRAVSPEFKPYLSLCHCTERNYGDGCIMVEWQPFGGKDRRIEI